MRLLSVSLLPSTSLLCWTRSLMPSPSFDLPCVPGLVRFASCASIRGGAVIRTVRPTHQSSQPTSSLPGFYA